MDKKRNQKIEKQKSKENTRKKMWKENNKSETYIHAKHCKFPILQPKTICE